MCSQTRVAYDTVLSLMYAVREGSIDIVEQSHINNVTNQSHMAAVCHETKEIVSMEQCKCGERYEQWGRRPAPPYPNCAKIHVSKAPPGETGTEQDGSKGKRAKCESSDAKGERKRENPQHPVKKTKTQARADIKHVFFHPSHGSKGAISCQPFQPFQAPIFRQEIVHDPMPIDSYEWSSEQARCDIVATNSSAPSPRDLPSRSATPIRKEVRRCQLTLLSPHTLSSVLYYMPRVLQLNVNLPLLQVELDQMQIDERGHHGEDLFVDKDALSPLARAPRPWHSALIPCHEPRQYESPWPPS